MNSCIMIVINLGTCGINTEMQIQNAELRVGTFVLCDREVFISNLVLEIGCPHPCRLILQAYTRTVHKIRLRLLPFTSFPFRNSTIALTFHTA
jgi:hypothetical protein